jgi:hypothetical protein
MTMSVNANIKSTLDQAIKNQTSAYFSANGVKIAFQTTLLSLEQNNLVIENSVPPRYIREVTQSNKFFLQVAMIRLHSERIASDGQNIIFPISDNSLIEEVRQEEREVFASDQKATAEILNPYDQETRIHKTLLDLSSSGLSLQTSFPSKLFQPDTFLPELLVRINGEIYKKTSGKVVYTRNLINQRGLMSIQVGIKFES